MRFLSLAALALFMSAPAHAEGLHVKYHINYLGVKVGEAKLNVNFADNGYSIGGNGAMAAFGKLVSDAKADVSAGGVVVGEAVKPTSFKMNALDDGKPNTVTLAMNKGTVSSQAVHPAQDKMDQRIKVEDAHRRNIVDPLSALVFPAPKGIHPDSCNRTLKIYDGRERYDVVLRFKSKYQLKGSSKNYSGPVLVCSARYKAIAGHRPNRRTIKQMEANTSMEVELAQVSSTPYLIVYKASLNTPAGPVSVNSVKMKSFN